MKEQQQPMLAPLTIFYSYAHEDEALRDKLEDHLSSLQAQGLISEWYDRQIVAGTEWAYAIDSHLQTASIILLLISPAFMASDYCVSIEMQQAMERHRLGDARVIPIILQPAEWHDAPFAILQCLPRGARPVTTWDDPEDAFEDITQGLRRAIEDMNLLFYGRGPRHPSAQTILAPSDGQWRKVSNRLPSPIDSQSRQRMLERVRTRWITGLLKDSLNEAALITLGLHEQPDAVANPWSFSLQEMNQPARALRLGTRMIQAYDFAQGELLILGEPGSGKTTLLLELTRDLIERAKRDETHPIPVIFNLSSWSLKQQPIADWLVEELIFKYQVPRKLAKRWVETEQVLPLLDGLDEVAPHNRAACIEALNRFKQDHGLLPMVICSRSADYLAQQSRVLLRTAIVIQPLTQEQIESYLASAKKQLAPIREALQADAELQELASTPLMLSILTLAYHGSSLNALLALSSPLARRQQIFATYVQRMFQRRGIEAHYTPQQTIQWLAWLAHQMKQYGLTEFYLERLQPSWLATQRKQKIHIWLFRLVVGLAFGLTIGLVFGLVVGLAFAWFYGLRSGLLGGLLSWLFFGSVGGLLGVLVGGLNENFWKKLLSALVVGTVFALLSGLVIGLVSALLVMLYEKDQEIQVADRLTLSWKHFWKKLPYGLALGLLIGLVGWWLSGPEVGLVTSLLGGLLLWLIIGLKGGLGSIQIAEDKRITPNQGIQNSGQNALRIGLMCMLGVGLLGGLTYGLLNGLATGLIDSLLDGLMAGLIFGQAYGGGSYLQHYVLRY